MVLQCCREIETADGLVDQCPNDGTEYHVSDICGLPCILHLCEKHSEEQTANLNASRHPSAAEKEAIEDAICDLMIRFGPDGHTDGSDKITEYVCCLIAEEQKSMLSMLAEIESLRSLLGLHTFPPTTPAGKP